MRSGTGGWGSGAGSRAARWPACGCFAAAAPTSHAFSTPPRPRSSSPSRSAGWGNYFNQELFGGPTSLPWGLAIDPAHRPPGYGGFATFQPTFLYEIVWNLSLAAFLVWLGKRGRARAPGLFALYVAGYSGFRIFEELLCIDPAHHLFGLRLNLYVAAALCLGGLAWFTRIQRRGSWRQRGVALLAAGVAALVCGCGQAPRSDAAAAVPRPGSTLRAGVHEESRSMPGLGSKAVPWGQSRGRR